MKQFESFGLDTSNECLWQNGASISLAPKPYAVLCYLVEHPGRLITHDELLEALWPETYVQPQVLRTYMLDLRKVLGDDAGQPRFIQTVPKRGYRFVAAVSESTERPNAAPSPKKADLIGTADGKPAATRNYARTSPSIVDRNQEMACLKEQVQLLAEGQRRVAFVTGEAGIGKTALVDAFCQQLDVLEPTARLGRGQCVEGFGSKEEYYPVTEALSQLCASPDGADACAVLARMAPAWLASLGRESAHAADAAGRERMAGDLCAALEELAADRPLMLVFEDLHWADDSTLHLISALARRRAPAKLMLLATYREQDVITEHPLRGLKQDLRLRRLCTEIALNTLPETAVKEMLARELKQEMLPKGLAGFVHRRSEGNPLFVLAILEHLIAQRYLVRKQNAGEEIWEQRAAFAEMEAGVPDGLAQMIEFEMERLSEDEQRLLEAGSLMSVAFPAWAVAAALEKDAAEVEEACDGLARRLHFVDRAGQDELPDGTRTSFYVFAHELYREVLYERQTEARRARRHVRIAKRLAEMFAGREGNVAREIAMHYEAAGDWRCAVDSLRIAARHALVRQAHLEAAELLERTLRVAENLSESERIAAAQEIGDELNAAREVLLEGASRQG